MCNSSYERVSKRIDPEMYKPSEALTDATGETFQHVAAANNTNLVGRRLFGAQHYMGSGSFTNPKTGTVSNVRLQWMERGTTTKIRSMSVEQTELDTTQRVFFFDLANSRVKTSGIEGADQQELNDALGLSLKERADQPLDAEAERILIESLLLGSEIGWQTS
jgi:hypothetical protein